MLRNPGQVLRLLRPRRRRGNLSSRKGKTLKGRGKKISHVLEQKKRRTIVVPLCKFFPVDVTSITSRKEASQVEVKLAVLEYGQRLFSLLDPEMTSIVIIKIRTHFTFSPRVEIKDRVTSHTHTCKCFSSPLFYLFWLFCVCASLFLNQKSRDVIKLKERRAQLKEEGCGIKGPILYTNVVVGDFFNRKWRRLFV